MAVHLSVTGAMGDTDTYFCEFIANRIAKVSPEVTVSLQALLEVDFLIWMQKQRTERAGGFCTHKQGVVVEMNGEFVGGLMDMVMLAQNKYGVEDAEIANTMQMAQRGKEEMKDALKAEKRTLVYIEFADSEGIGNEDPVEYGQVVIQLLDDLAPLASKNFVNLCTGVNAKGRSYHECPIHRIVPGGWLQCGDVIDGSGSNSEATVGKEGKFEDETFCMDFAAEFGGIVGMASKDTHSNGSQFFITLGPCGWMNNQSVGFGRIIHGLRVLEKISSVNTKNQRPVVPVVVSNSGIY
jgi:cyclophilin family peptidyl-prolyl cis-trans isomerase